MNGPMPTSLRSAAGSRLTPRLRSAVYLLLVVLVVSGTAWLIAHLCRPQDALPGPIEPWSMKVHGGAAMAFLFLGGALQYRHILPAWSLRRTRVAGMSTCASFVALAMTGYGLYYFDGDVWHRLTERLHWAAGIALPALLALHIAMGRKARGISRSPARHKR